MGALLALLLLIGSPDDSAIQTLDEALNDECVYIGEAVGADYCAYQFTDVMVLPQIVTARAQFSVGCDDAPSRLQEAEYLVDVRIDTGEMVHADRIQSRHLPNGGVEKFTRLECDVRTY